MQLCNQRFQSTLIQYPAKPHVVLARENPAQFLNKKKANAIVTFCCAAESTKTFTCSIALDTH